MMNCFTMNPNYVLYQTNIAYECRKDEANIVEC